MNFRYRSYRGADCSVLTLIIVLLNSLNVAAQAPQAEHHFPTQANPRIAISNASTIAIVPWAKNEVSITAEVSGATLQVDEVKIKQEKKGLEINCVPAKPDRSIYLTLSVPPKATLDSCVETTDPARCPPILRSRYGGSTPIDGAPATAVGVRPPWAGQAFGNRSAVCESDSADYPGDRRSRLLTPSAAHSGHLP